MNITSLASDNITELLSTIVAFTKKRHEVLVTNLQKLNDPEFAPMDLPTNEFSSAIDHALTQHTLQKRLVLCDSENVKFGPGGSFETSATVDEQCFGLLERDKDQYIETQISKLMENSLNQKLAMELLSQKQHI